MGGFLSAQTAAANLLEYRSCTNRTLKLETKITPAHGHPLASAGHFAKEGPGCPQPRPAFRQYGHVPGFYSTRSRVRFMNMLDLSQLIRSTLLVGIPNPSLENR